MCLLVCFKVIYTKIWLDAYSQCMPFSTCKNFTKRVGLIIPSVPYFLFEISKIPTPQMCLLVSVWDIKDTYYPSVPLCFCQIFLKYTSYGVCLHVSLGNKLKHTYSQSVPPCFCQRYFRKKLTPWGRVCLHISLWDKSKYTYSPSVPPCLCLRYLNKGWPSFPFTFILENISNWTLNLSVTKVFISASVPGSLKK